jgi:hypothetical protein
MPPFGRHGNDKGGDATPAFGGLASIDISYKFLISMGLLDSYDTI